MWDPPPAPSMSIYFDRMVLLIWRVGEPDDSVLGVTLIGVFETSWIRLAPWHCELDSIFGDALAYQKLFDPLGSLQ
jgi:hypothetical protein